MQLRRARGQFPFSIPEKEIDFVLPSAQMLVDQLRDFPVGHYTDRPDVLHQGLTLLVHLMAASGPRPRLMA